MHKPDDQTQKPKLTRLIRPADVMKLTVFGWYFASALLICVVGGWALDKWLDTSPLFTLLGILIGSVAGFYGMYKMMKPLLREKKDGRNKPE